MTRSRVVAAVIRRDDRWLVCQRPEHKRHGGLWEFPGGKLHQGETVTEAVRRELGEELHVLTTSVGEVEFSAPDPDSEFVIEFVQVVIEGVPHSIEHQAVAWLPLAEILDLPLAPSDRSYVEHLHRKVES